MLTLHHTHFPLPEIGEHTGSEISRNKNLSRELEGFGSIRQQKWSFPAIQLEIDIMENLEKFFDHLAHRLIPSLGSE